MNQAFVIAVRNAGSKNTDRVLIVAGYNNDIDMTVMDGGFSKPTDTSADRLMLSVHYYDPYDFTLNENGTAEWDEDTDAIAAQFNKISEFAKRENIGMPVFLGEYSPIDKNNPTASGEYCYWLNYYAKTLGMATGYWDNGVMGVNGQLKSRHIF